MQSLPVIVALGGVNPAGRISGHHAYRRLVIDALSDRDADPTWESLAVLMGVDDSRDSEQRRWMAEHTLIRHIEHFDPQRINQNRRMRVSPVPGETIRFRMPRRDLPEQLPEGWQVDSLDQRSVQVEITGTSNLLLPDTRRSRVTSAGQLPTGFDPGQSYQSRNHPRTLELSIWGASDTVRWLGIGWQTVRDAVRPDEIAVYAGSGMSQLDHNGYAGLMQSHLVGSRVTSKQLPLGLSQMPADFVNAYVIGSVGSTGANIGACATFLYNLRQGIDDIRSGRRRVVIVGSAEAPIQPEVIEGFRTMGALAEDDALAELDGQPGPIDNRRASRPFSDNCGFTLAEGSVYAVLFDDTLALELGANVLGSVGDVFVNADGFKKSISGPGVGNYVTVAKAMASARGILGETGLARTFVQAHGTSTPQNRVTESSILDTLAGVFGLSDWPVAAVKAYVGHTLGPAAGDQLAATLGAFEFGVLPGITTIDHIADDVHCDHVLFPMQHLDFGKGNMDGALINSKGFGGNNGTALILAPHVTESMLRRRHGDAAIGGWRDRNILVAENAAAYDASMRRGLQDAIYHFGQGVIEGAELDISAGAIRVPGFEREIDLDIAHPFPDMTE